MFSNTPHQNPSSQTECQTSSVCRMSHMTNSHWCQMELYASLALLVPWQPPSRFTFVVWKNSQDILQNNSFCVPLKKENNVGLEWHHWSIPKNQGSIQYIERMNCIHTTTDKNDPYMTLLHQIKFNSLHLNSWHVSFLITSFPCQTSVRAVEQEL